MAVCLFVWADVNIAIGILESSRCHMVPFRERRPEKIRNYSEAIHSENGLEFKVGSVHSRQHVSSLGHNVRLL